MSRRLATTVSAVLVLSSTGSEVLAAGGDTPFIWQPLSGSVGGVYRMYFQGGSSDDQYGDHLQLLSDQEPTLPIDLISSGSFTNFNWNAGSVGRLTAEVDTFNNPYYRPGIDIAMDWSVWARTVDLANWDTYADIVLTPNLPFIAEVPLFARVTLNAAGTATNALQQSIFRLGDEQVTVSSGQGLVQFDRYIPAGELVQFQFGVFEAVVGTGPEETRIEGSLNASFDVMVQYEGLLQYGPNDFSSPGANNFLDTTGICSPSDQIPHGRYIEPLYFEFTPTRNGLHTFSTCNQTRVDTRLAVLVGDPLPENTIACADESEGCANYTTRLTVDLTSGERYTIVLGSYTDWFGSGVLSVTLAGDLNDDGIVDGGDIGLLIGNWGGSGLGDLNGDGNVDAADLGLMLGYFSS